MVELQIVREAAEASVIVATRLADALAENPDLVLGVATGSTPQGTYRELAKLVRERGLRVSGVRAFALDEYVGLPVEHPQSYAAVVQREITEPLGLNPGNVHVPDGVAADDASCQLYEQAIANAGSIDVQLLGIGSDGHIGFNEPDSAFDSRTRVTDLHPSTRLDNARFFSSIDEVPTHAVTQGIATILEARSLVMLAFGANKAPAIAAAFEGPVTESVPASALQRHPNALVVIDEAAASQLTQGR